MSQSEFIDLGNLATLSGTSIAVVLLCNVCHYVFGWNPRWFGLVVSLLLCGAGIALAQDHRLVVWILLPVRGAQVYATAVGIASLTGIAASTKPAEPSERRGVVPSKPNRQFWIKWF